MTEEVWNPARYNNDEPMADGTFIRVNGSNVPVEVGTSFTLAVTNTAKQAGLGKFRVFKDGTEVKPAQAPDMITEGMKLEIRPYDVAG
jgi:hypothetical protein